MCACGVGGGGEKGKHGVAKLCVGESVGGCVFVRVEERVAERAYLLVGYTLDYWIVAILFTKLWINTGFEVVLQVYSFK